MAVKLQLQKKYEALLKLKQVIQREEENHHRLMVQSREVRKKMKAAAENLNVLKEQLMDQITL